MARQVYLVLPVSWKNLNGERKPACSRILTTQVRSISEVASAVTKGDLTRTIRVEAKGEVEALKDTINQMITNLRDNNAARNQDQDWLKSNLAKFTQMLQGQRDLNTVTKRILSELAQVVNAHYGAFYILKQDEETLQVKLNRCSLPMLTKRKSIPKEFAIGEGLVGQCAFEKERILIHECSVELYQNKFRARQGQNQPTSSSFLYSLKTT